MNGAIQVGLRLRVIGLLTTNVAQLYNSWMKYIFIAILMALSPSISYASKVVECLGEDIFNNKAVAQIFLEDGKGRIVINIRSDTPNSAANETIESSTEIKVAGDVLQVWGNIFVMQFSMSKEKPAFPVDAFRDGAFWVTDFNCRRVD